MMYTCDDANGLQAGIPLDGTLRTINMQEDPNGNIAALRIHQPDRPVLIPEYWTGWFDWWGDKHHDLGLDSTKHWGTTYSHLRLITTGTQILLTALAPSLH